MLDIARTLAAGVRAAGTACALDIDLPPSPSRNGLLQLVVAPHEYFPLFLEPRLETEELERAARGVHVLNVEQPGSFWFERAWDYARLSQGVFDISTEGVAEFRARGLNAEHTPLGILGDAPETKPPAVAVRSIDVVFLGHASNRRQQFFGAHADLFSRHNCRLLFADLSMPRRADSPGYYCGVERSALLRDTKIVLNIHSREGAYFESHRALLALSHGCVLVTENSRATAPLINETHFVMAPLDDLGRVCDELLQESDRLDAIGRAGYDLAHSRLTMADSCRTILARAQRGDDRRTEAERAERRREAVRQRLSTSRANRATDGPDWTTTDNPAYASSETPRLTVVVTVYNYARFLDQCLESVCASDPVPGGVELVIVDDGSTDDSANRATAIAASAPLPTRLVRKLVNTGVADARNVGLQEARGAFVLTLDADNWLYPTCLSTLTAAIEEGPYAAVYPLIRRFNDDSGESTGLLSLYPWSVPDLVRGPYIDALALFRRDVILELGGYSTELIEHGWFGWEDYDLWLKLADAGHACAQVPNVLAAYRVHDGTMLRQTNQNSTGLAQHLRHKFRGLAAAHPGLDSYFSLSLPGGQSPFAGIGGHPEPPGRRSRSHDAELRALYASWSWRITAPLRAAYRLLSGRP